MVRTTKYRNRTDERQTKKQEKQSQAQEGRHGYKESIQEVVLTIGKNKYRDWRVEYKCTSLGI
jgi:hypothetical protein